MHWLLAAAAGCSSQSNNPYNITAGDIGVPCSTPTLGAAVANGVTIMMELMGGLALIFVIVGGLRYVLSAGDPKRTNTAKETILYACIGLALSIAGYAIVAFIAGATSTVH
jgi:hypothetical protein